MDPAEPDARLRTSRPPLAEARVAIAHEWLAARMGSEKTFEAMAAALPNARLFALSVEPNQRWLVDRPIATTFLDRPWLRHHRSLTLSLMPLAWRLVTREHFDVAVTSSHACVKGFRPGRAAVHLCYVYTPMRYAWLPDLDPRHRVAARLGAPLRLWDRRATRWVNDFASISTAVAERVRRFYGRDSTVIPPPVDVDWFTPEGPRDDYLVAVGRFVAYKRFDRVVDLARRVDRTVVIAGDGPLEGRLQAAARDVPNLRLEVAPGDERVRALMRGAAALVVPAEEDFGLAAVEAQACGTPVIGVAAGGLLDTVVDGTTGVLVERADAGALAAAVARLDQLQGDTVDACRSNARRFGRAEFTRRFTAWVGANV